MPDETYNGWTNRETWAVALHINNDQGWQESVLEAVRNAVDGVMQDPPTGFDDESPLSRARREIRAAAEAVRADVESMLDLRAFEQGVPELVILALDDIGSLWRVDWTELGAAFLSDLEEQS